MLPNRKRVTAGPSTSTLVASFDLRSSKRTMIRAIETSQNASVRTPLIAGGGVIHGLTM